MRLRPPPYSVIMWPLPLVQRRRVAPVTTRTVSLSPGAMAAGVVVVPVPPDAAVIRTRSGFLEGHPARHGKWRRTVRRSVSVTWALRTQ